MARAKTLRTLHDMPVVKGFRPLSMRANYRQAVILKLEEYEVLRLIDYEQKIHEEVAEMMDVSRPTVTRIYNSARSKISTALVEGRSFLIEGGDVRMVRHYYQCEDCLHRVNLPVDEEKPLVCIACGSTKIISLSDCFVRGCRHCRRCR
ncbi:MAG: DUF134 domain-containing protein [Candidatus Cloacimonetes bacterium]|jgi:predicted DNA-binding protein (UPF0251 family)|nr:DUF134 domain-containing protein [Candidatus Cloacimonadota bacterium]MCB5287175.1 DUF134 domain-containing protein [Candidatus Cloacimonadota bacterium]MCK9185342.1 DUF134 domain-containing protein [Candidatus Cloacimonadota bacterium]MCK9583692.1 DUF134 domain-containing protein [Candidatus Cloacimonadota bacterium]MDY0229496.1 DUF134 domain-containing protein [Candidatus Cloacimonadaceae bacterium]